ncbi:hypothetical protein OS493_008138 [Desmophyllum pertusum]|uniref:C-type lectin domain-containing protein n=1 Tax=Desmophyllum pertusum TaxID=174260 RepID=A0A9X0A3Q8_9CNID|nr:hypothetical protein OS493_008138 [Desmophyllum pertusum]
MHYLMTIKTTDPKYQNRIGQRQYLTPSDILMMNNLYGCPETCPQGWVLFSNACYQVNSGKKNIQDATDSCLDNGGGILTLRSIEEEKFLRAELVKKNLNNMFYWLGAKYSPSKGSFLWPDATEVVYNAWSQGEPRFGLDCALMMNREGWGTDRCDMERSYICKRELKTYKRSEVKIKTEKKGDYKWQTEDWDKCSVSCGGGQKKRKTFCAGEDKKEVENSFCEDSPPIAWKDCNVEPCPSHYKWHVGNWRDCSRTCGGGIKRRKKMCAGKDMISTSWKLCKNQSPITKKKCNTEPCPRTKTRVPSSPVWKVSLWSKCSKTCRSGHQIRGVFCSKSDNKPLIATACSGQTKPVSLKPCVLKDCTLKRGLC